MDNEFRESSPLPSLLGADLEVLAWQIWHGLGPNHTMSECHKMFYMLANVHYQMTFGKLLSPSTSGTTCRTYHTRSRMSQRPSS